MCSKNLLCLDGILASILANGQQIMNNEFRSATQKKEAGGWWETMNLIGVALCTMYGGLVNANERHCGIDSILNVFSWEPLRAKL
jgi:hypothetical protein